MATTDLTGLFRPELLDGVVVLLAAPAALGPPAAAGFTAAVQATCVELGAQVSSCEPHATDEQQVDAAVQAAVAKQGGLDMLVVDGASLFAQLVAGGAADSPPAAADGHAALRTCLDTAWNVTRAVINHAFLPGERAGRIVYLAPAPDAGEFAESARAGLENLSRTLSVEWARHGVNVVCIAPGMNTAASEVADICAYLASPAGAYFSGCLLDLRGV
jgi:NAD(P)-dependent dehydrogenase (short-subunit alcohol dehydrogenase family)